MNTIRFFKLLIAAFVVTIVSLMLIYPPPKSISLSNLSSGLEADIEEPSNYGDESIKSRYNDKIAPILEKQSKFKKKKFMMSQKNIPVYSKNVVSENLEKSPTCGYEICPHSKPGLINVHLVPHTHDDVGWLNTLEQYYSGSMKSDPKISVAKIIDTVVDELQVDPSRRFIYAEMAFFQKWWKDQNEERRDVVRNLVANGRLEFVNGGWCMNDEATTHYVDIIDQMSLGLNFLNDTFGECGRPRIAWQIDPFGHSKEHASIMAQMGFDGMFLSRIHVQDKEQRANTKNLELVWHGNQNLGEDGKLFTGVLFNHYAAPKGFCFDKLTYCNAKSIDESDVEKRVKDFLDFCQKQADSYRTNNIILTMGHDFTYQNASTWFTPMDKLIKHANKLQETVRKFNLFYSTLSCYAKSLNDHDTTWPSKTDDFFPIASTPVEYWTGYYSSRPALKYMVRQGSNVLQSCKQMASFLSMKSHELIGDISLMKEAMAVLQHHDAVTGTEKQHVANDYARLLHMGVEECHKIQNSFYQNNLPRKKESLPEVSYCQLNLTQCDVTEKTDRFVVNVYNSLASNIDKYVRVPVVKQDNSNYQVLDPNGEVITSELVPIAKFVKSLPGRKSSATHELVFLVFQLPPLGSKSYYVEPVLEGETSEIEEETTAEVILTKRFKKRALLKHKLDDGKFIENERITVRLNEETGLIQSISIDGDETELKQEFFWYAGNNRGNMRPPNNDEGSAKASGAYLFRPNQSDPFPVRNNEEVATTIYKGGLVQEIHQSYKNWAFQTIRLYKGQDHVELDWVVGPIPVADRLGKEVLSRFTTKLGSKKEFYTDTNGRQILKRKRNIRDTYKCNVTLDPVAGNYYPVNSQIFIKDEKKNKQLTILVDRAQGGSSLRDGQLELMIHRRLLHDDDFGVQEPLNEVAYGVGLAVRGTHFLILSRIDESAQLARSLNHQIYKQPQISFISTELSFQEWTDSFNTEISTLSSALPENVNLLTLDKRTDGKYLLRLEHIYGEGEDVELSKPVTVNLKDLFKGFIIESAQETLLGGNQLKKESKRLVWKDESNQTKQNNLFPTDFVIDLENILIYPMQIRSFILSFN